ncbi:DUF4157 domain-containing protein [Nordella sp. HKS 07]|uniref:eCIS core domain-containing protein n=1 Tax=Nordella sp. HKS 07 TaxID=2712222 RepID=UPI0019D2366E|nr:DUF4157 domain-containing protein [Nordella sp. HKS 07]
MVAKTTAGIGNGSSMAATAFSQGGMPLSREQRAYFEPRFRHDFSDVRLHTHAEAGRAARGIEARAFTYGRDIAFARGGYDTRLLAHELTHVVQQRGGSPTIQRQPDDKGEIEMPMEWAFAGDPKRATDIRYARSQGKADARRLRKAGTLSTDDRAEINAKMRFFDGKAYDAYVAEVKPALIEVTREEIDMGAEEKKTPAADPMATGFDRFKNFPSYIDNEITKVEYFTAELAIIHYKDGTKFELGLTAQWMKPPVVEVDYTTPRHLLHPFSSAKNEARFFREGDKTPRTATFDEIRTKYSSEVKFYVEQGTGRIVPSHINMLTAPTLCGVLQSSLERYEEQVDMAVKIGIGGTAAIGGYAGAGGLPKNVGVGLGTTTARRIVSSTVAKAVPAEVNTTLKTLGVTEHDIGQFALGQKVFGQIERGGIEFTPYFIKEGDTLVAGVLSAASKGDPSSMIKAYLTFRRSATEMAKSLGAKTLRLEADVVVNTEGLIDSLLKRGFKLVDEASSKYALEIPL